MQPTEFIWQDGALIHWNEAKVHVLAHGLHYGSSVFEGIRVYDTPRGPAFFRLRDHLERLYASARIYRMAMPLPIERLAEVCADVVRANGLRSAYVRPIAYRGVGSLALVPRAGDPVQVAVAAIAWGPYLGAEGLEHGVDVGVSSWNRLAPNTMPTLAKAGGNYLSSQLISMEAQRHGYAEGLALDTNGYLSEGAGENLFLVRDGVLLTPPSSAAVLPGITRDSVIQLARGLGVSVREEPLPRELLYLADEAFFTGTAAEITPIRSVDGMPMARACPGPITAAMQRSFFGLFRGETEDRWNWLQEIEAATRSSERTERQVAS